MTHQPCQSTEGR